MKKKEILIFILSVISGSFLGFLSKYGDVAIMGSLFGDIMSAFGNLTSAFFIWIAACAIIVLYSEKRIYSSLNVFAFLLSMLITYYLYSSLVVEYLSVRVTVFWAIMLLPSAILACIVWGMRQNKKLRNAVIALSTLEMVFDVFILQGGEPFGIMITAVLYFVLIFCIITKTKQTAKRS